MIYYTHITMNSLINKLKMMSIKDFVIFVNKQSLSTLHDIKTYCDDIYYNSDNSSVCITDEKYDLIVERIICLENPGYVLPIGAKVSDDLRSVSLPYYLGSMNKYKNEKDITKWVSKRIDSSYFLLSEKLDGVSCLLYITKDKKMKLYTRGDGLNGTDISHYAPFIKTLTKINIEALNKANVLAVRGELIIKKKTFETKYSSLSANARNFVSGVVNSKTLKNEITDVDFIAYEIVNSAGYDILKQLEILVSLTFTVVKYYTVKEITLDILTQFLIQTKMQSHYEIDGIIVHDGTKYIRNTSKNPEYAFAFKMLFGENVVETEVIGVEWNVTKWNIMKPTIKVKPINISGVTIQYATGFNAGYILQNEIGPGSRVKITRSGDVIPFVQEIVTRTKAEMPTIPYDWKDGGNIDITVSDDASNETANIKIIVSFFADLKIKYVSEATVTKMFKYGLNTLPKIFAATIDDLTKIDTINLKSAERIYENIHNGLKGVYLHDILGASCVLGFGIGRRKTQELLKNLPCDLFNFYYQIKDNDCMVETIMAIPGFQYKTAQKIVDNIPNALEFLKEIEPYVTYKKPIEASTVVDNLLKDKSVVFSGFRDTALEERIKNQGGKVSTSVSKNTSMVIVKTIEETSSKVEKAKTLGINIISKDEFIKLL